METETPAVEPELQPALSGSVDPDDARAAENLPPLEPAPRRDREGRLLVTFDEVEFRDSGDPAKKNIATLRGHAAVFNKLSEDLGGFRELLEPGAFRAALRSNPDVRLLFNHDPNFVLARTASKTLELREDTRGLHVFAEVDKSMSWVSDLRKSMQRGDVDQMSFAFTMNEGGDDWAITEDGTVIRTIRADGVDELFDVSVVTYPAYTETHVAMRSVLQDAISRGRLPELTVEEAGKLAADESQDEPTVAPEGVGEEAPVAPSEGEEQSSPLDELKRASAEAKQREREEYLRLLKEMR